MKINKFFELINEVQCSLGCDNFILHHIMEDSNFTEQFGEYKGISTFPVKKGRYIWIWANDRTEEEVLADILIRMDINKSDIIKLWSTKNRVHVVIYITNI